MKITDYENDMETIELIIDSQGLSFVIQMLEQICYEKSEHVEVNWQDKELADYWLNAGVKIGSLWPRIKNL